jgi:hypothetical protein
VAPAQTLREAAAPALLAGEGDEFLLFELARLMTRIGCAFLCCRALAFERVQHFLRA